MRPEMPDRPVSLASVLWNLDDANLDPDVLADLRDRMECLGTFAPDVDDEQGVNVDEMATALGIDKCACGCGMFVQTTDTIKAMYAEHTAPTKPPREMPAPEWTGPDRWQAWCNLGTPDDVPVTPGFVAIGPWEPCGIAAVVTTNPEHITDIVRDWRRPLRRVQG